jgi:hypothetical protein
MDLRSLVPKFVSDGAAMDHVGSEAREWEWSFVHEGVQWEPDAVQHALLTPGFSRPHLGRLRY